MPEHTAEACPQEKYTRGSTAVESMPGQHTRGKKVLFDGV